MSDCNYCSLKRIKERAKRDGKKVTQQRAVYQLGGTDVFVHPKDVKPTNKHFVMWAMELTDHCCC